MNHIQGVIRHDLRQREKDLLDDFCSQSNKISWTDYEYLYFRDFFNIR